MKRTGSGKNYGKNRPSTARSQTPAASQTPERRSRSPESRRSRSPEPYGRYSEPRRSEYRTPEPRRSSQVSSWYPENRRMTLNLRSQEVPMEMDIREENAFLRGRIAKLNVQLDNATGELHELRRDISDLRTSNQVASQEIDELREELENLQAEDRPSERQKGKRPVRSGDESEGRLTKRQKGKRPVYAQEEVEYNDKDEEARVRCQIFHFIL